MERPIEIRNIPSRIHTHRQTDLVHNVPDRPTMEHEQLDRASIRLVGSHCLETRGAPVVVKRTPIPYSYHYDKVAKQMVDDTVSGRTITPIVARPITPFKQIVRGERTITIGGGTSTEALRRARRKAARRALTS